MAQWMKIQGMLQIFAMMPNIKIAEGLCIDDTVCSSDCRRKTAYGYSQNTESTQRQYTL